MEIHEDFEHGFERNKQDHDPFESSAVPLMLRAFQRIEALAVMGEPVVDQLEMLVNQFVIHGS